MYFNRTDRLNFAEVAVLSRELGAENPHPLSDTKLRRTVPRKWRPVTPNNLLRKITRWHASISYEHPRWPESDPAPRSGASLRTWKCRAAPDTPQGGLILSPSQAGLTDWARLVIRLSASAIRYLSAIDCRGCHDHGTINSLKRPDLLQLNVPLKMLRGAAPMCRSVMGPDEIGNEL